MGSCGKYLQVIAVPILAAVVQGQDRCDSEMVPLDSRCSGCPPTYNGKLCASTTRYNDQTKGACGCGPSDPVPADWWTMTQYTAALNCKSLDAADPLLSWCPGGCGGCYELCTTGGTTQGQVTSDGVCHVFKVSNRCGDGFQDHPDWCSNEMSWQECVDNPDQCKQKGSTNRFGYSAHFDLEDFASQISIGEGWDNVEVTFEPVSCDLWDGPSWDCECAAVFPPPSPSPPSPPSPPGPSWYKTITPSSNTDLCLDLPGDDASNGNHLWLWECNGSESQRWVFDNYQIRFGADESKCIDAGDMSNGLQLFLWDCNGYPQQSWGFDFDASRMYLTDTSTCLDFYGDWQSSGQPLHVWDCSGDWNQEWSLWNLGATALNVLGNGTELVIV